MTERTRTKVKAMLAAGMVIGVGATGTLASWSHDSHVGVTLETANFLVDGQLEISGTSGTAGYEPYDPEVPHTPQMRGEYSDFGPTSAAAAVFWMRMDPASNAAIDRYTVEFTGVELSGENAENIEFSVHFRVDQNSGAGCGGNGQINTTQTSVNFTGHPHIERQALSSSPSTVDVQPMARSQYLRACVNFYGTERLQPNDELNLTFQVTIRPEE